MSRIFFTHLKKYFRELGKKSLTVSFNYAYIGFMDKNGGINSQKLREYREKMKLTRYALDKLAGVGEHTVRNAESGKNISVRSLKKIAEALGVPAAVFLD